MDGFGDDFWRKYPKIPRVIPVLVRPDSSYTNDSTPIIIELESTFLERRILPDSADLRFFSALIEDFADEWITKIMFEGPRN